jgi:hypothetical protein
MSWNGTEPLGKAAWAKETFHETHSSVETNAGGLPTARHGHTDAR